MKIIVLSDGCLIEKDIPNQLKDLQHEVKGQLEKVSFIDEFNKHSIITLVNEDGKMLNEVPQLVVAHEIYIVDILVGNVLFVGFDGVSDFCGLSDEQIAIIKRTLRKKIPYKGEMVYVIDQ